MLNIREKTAQLIIPRLDGNRLVEEDYVNQIADLIDAGIGGFILFGGKIPETPAAIRRLQERAKAPLLITSDIERGLGQQLVGGTRFPSQWAVAEAINPQESEDVNLLTSMLNVVREECIATGIHAVYSPVADVNVNPDNPIICTRSFGEDPETVSWFVKEYVKGLQSADCRGVSVTRPGRGSTSPLQACAKHFPGHGDTAVDSHTSLPIINANMERLERVELPPFQAAIDAGVAMIMVGHLRVPALEPDPIPATFSRRIVTNLLKEQMGFKGLVVTDALDMGALKALCDEGESAVRALMAGCDIMLHPSEPLKAFDAVIDAVKNGRLSEDRIDEAFTKVMDIKKQLSVSSGPWSEIGIQQSKDIADEIAGKAVKFIKGRGLNSSENMVCLVIDDDGDGSVAAPFINAMKELMPHLRRVSVSSEIKGGETVVIPVFSRVSAWKGRSGLSRDSFEKIKSATDRAGRSVVVSFGSPYILNSLNADVMINAFDPADFMQRAAVDRLME